MSSVDCALSYTFRYFLAIKKGILVYFLLIEEDGVDTLHYVHMYRVLVRSAPSCRFALRRGPRRPAIVDGPAAGGPVHGVLAPAVGVVVPRQLRVPGGGKNATEPLLGQP